MSKPLFLVCNDDGFDSPGIKALEEVAAQFGDVYVVAPMSERSACSHGVTITSPLRIKQTSDQLYAVDGTPADCIILALENLLPRKPDWILSGINRGPNLGTDVLYSGTVAAALEGCLRGVKSMAVSCFSRNDQFRYDTASRVVHELLQNKTLQDDSVTGVLNVNVPACDFEQLKGIAAFPLGERKVGGEVHEIFDPKKRKYFWIGSTAECYERLHGTDCEAVLQGYASVSVLKPSLADEKETQKLRGILSE